jgi:hypothetical protein
VIKSRSCSPWGQPPRRNACTPSLRRVGSGDDRTPLLNLHRLLLLIKIKLFQLLSTLTLVTSRTSPLLGVWHMRRISRSSPSDAPRQT